MEWDPWSGEPVSSSDTHQPGDLGLLGLQCLKYTAPTRPWHTVAGVMMGNTAATSLAGPPSSLSPSNGEERQ